jgi:outer membrane autotransporter protein
MAGEMELSRRFLRHVARSTGFIGQVSAARPKHLVVSLLAWVSLGADVAHAQDATWLLNPGTGDWNTAGNWTPVTVPSNTAIFGASNTVSLTFSASPTSINTIQFNAGAPGYTFNVTGTLDINGTGIVNNSSNTPSFLLNGTLNFFNSSTSGNAAITNNVSLNFFNSSTAGSAIITSNSGLFFNDSSTAGNANITTNAGLHFLNSSSAGAATITTNSGGGVFFAATSSGGQASFITNSGGVFDMSGLTSAGMTAGSIAGAGHYFLGSKILNVGGNNMSTMVSGLISDGGVSGGTGGALLKTGTGTLTLSGANTFTGGTEINGGVLSLSHVTAGAIDAAGPGAIGMSGGTLETALTGTLANDITFVSTPGVLDVLGAVAGTTVTLTGNLHANGAAVFGSATDTGTIVVNSASTTSLTPSTATLEVAGNGTVLKAATGNVGLGTLTALVSSTTVDTGATLDFNGNSATIKNLQGAGTVTDSVGGQTLTINGGFFSGAINGVGENLTLAMGGGTGLLILAGNSGYTGLTTIGVGTTLQLGNGGTAGSIPGNIVDNGILISNRSDTFTLPGAISGAGEFRQNGSGKTILTGASTYTGPTNINAGILDVNGSLVSTVSVNNGGTLMGNGTIGGLAVNGGGTVAPGNSIGTLNVSGNVAFGSGSTYQVEINAAGQGDKIAATGKATLTGGTVQVLAANGLYTPALRYTILTANGGVSGTFAQLAVSSNITSFAFLTPALSYDANDVFLGFAQTATLQSVALTRNQASTATAIQALGLGNPIFNAVVGQSVAGARQAFDALSGEIHASAVTAAFEDQRPPRDAIFDRLSQPAETPVLGAATTMTGAYAADLPSRKGPVLAPVAVQMVQPRLFGLWGQGFGDWGRTGGDHNAAKLTRDTEGFIIGADAERQLFNGDWRFGVAAGYTDDSLKVSARSSSGDYQSIFGALYGKASYGAIDLKAGAILASTDTHTNRSIIFPGFADAASSSYGGTAAQGFGELGYRLPFHGTLWSYVPGLSGLSATYEPFLQGALIHIDQNQYVETALTGAALVGAARSYDVGTTTLGLRTQYQLASLPGFTWTSLLGWRHAYGDVIPKVSQTFAGSFSSFSIAGVPIDRDAFVSETSLDYAVSQRVTVGLSYAGQYGRRATDSAFKGHLDVSFW